MQRLSRFLADHRRLIAAALAGLATFAALSALTADPAPTRSVLVAAHDLPSGHVLTDADITRAALPQESAVRSVTRPVGAMTAGAMRAGEPLTDRRVVDPRALPDGQVLASISVERSAAALVRAGDRVEIIAVPEASDVPAEPLVQGAEVVVMREREGTDVATLGVAVPPETARIIASASAVSRLTVSHAVS